MFYVDFVFCNFTEFIRQFKTFLLECLGFSIYAAAAAAAKSLQSCLTLCDPIDGSPSGFTVPRILQTRTLEWVAISFSISIYKIM